MRRFALMTLLCLTVPSLTWAQAVIVAQRGGVNLTVADVRLALDALEPTQRAQVQANPATLAEFVRERLLRQSLLAEAKAGNFDQNAALIARANDARDAIIVQTYLAAKAPVDPNYPTKADISAAYETNKARFAVPKQYHVQQIAFLIQAGASKEAEEEARKKALDARQQALKPKADFGELAKKLSQDQASSEKGGDLGWVREDQLQAPVRALLVTMSDTAISEVVRGPDAWHVVRLIGTKPPSTLPLDQVSDTLVQALRQNRAQQNVRAYVGQLLQAEPIQLNEIDLARQISGAR